ncbi:MAG: PQQ-binding-like beta-propeller repeat protein [Verrucomicrobia bacterium]|nr:PQQ-binding-like beta-propeller repeat protein [Verrucomicrobiota bacterium]
MVSGLLASGVPGGLTSRAADWPQYRGLNHDGITTESVTPWGSQGPRVIWKSPTPTGFSSFSVSQGRAFTLVQGEVGGATRELCVAFDATSGQRLWEKPVGVAKYDGGGDSGTSDNKGGDGPRSTPSVDGSSVYVLSAQLYLACLDAATGEERWGKDIIREFKGRNISWQSAASPLIDGDLIFVAGGGPDQSLLAFNKTTGAVVWKTGDEKMTHATPAVATIQGVRQVIFFTQSGLVAVEAATGKPLWRYAFPYRVSTAASPVVGGDIVYCSAGYGVGAAAVRISRSGENLVATELWRLRGDRPVVNHWSTPVYHDGHLYGMFSFKNYGDGPVKCVELATGKVRWEEKGFGPGNMILAGDRLVALGDAGQLVLIEATPEAYRELARAEVLQGKCWSTPVVSGGRIYARSTVEGVCLEVAP